MFKIQFSITDREINSLVSQLVQYLDRFDDEVYDGKVYDEFLSVLSEYKDCIKGFEVVGQDRTDSRIRFASETDDEDPYVEVWINHVELVTICGV